MTSSVGSSKPLAVTSPQTPPPAPQSMVTFTPRARRLLPIVFALGTLLLIGIAFVVGQIVQNAMQNITQSTLKSILSANVTSLEIWLTEQEFNASRAAQDDVIQAAASHLITRSQSITPRQYHQLQSDPANPQLLETIGTDEHEARKYVGWCVLRLDHVVVASDIESLVGKSLPLPDFVNESIVAMKPVVCHAIRSPVPLSSDGPLSIPGGPVMAAIAPIESENQCVGGLVFLADPLGRFTELLSIARTGVSGETYAFDQTARLVSQSRFENQLRDANLLPDDVRITSPLNVSVRNPGVNLTHGVNFTVTPQTLPLTLMADEATRGGTGSNVVGYNDYRGVPVVGAWTWLPDHHIGVATELDVHEAYAPMRLLRRSFWSLLALTMLSALVSLALLAGNRRLSGLGNDPSMTRQLGQYQLGDMLGKGGMGSVYRGTHEFLRRSVAVKVLESEEMTDQAATRFEREVQMTASLRHPNTIDVYDFGRTPDGTFFYVMEYVNGISLQELVDRFGPQPPGRVIYLLEQICGSMSEAHHYGLIHRDIKPANVIVSGDIGLQDHVRVLDFGLIKSITAAPSDETLTRCDTITGTPMYMSPEAVKDANSTGPLSDLYSLGAVGYTLLTGEPIFESAGSVEICMRQVKEYPVRPADRLGRELPEDLQNVLMSCLRKSPSERPQSMDDLAFALRSCEDAGTWDHAEALRWWEVVFSQKNTVPQV